MWMLPRASWGEYENAAPIERLNFQARNPGGAGIHPAEELAGVAGVAGTLGGSALAIGSREVGLTETLLADFADQRQQR
jgi:hypothetical protein